MEMGTRSGIENSKKDFGRTVTIKRDAYATEDTVYVYGIFLSKITPR